MRGNRNSAGALAESRGQSPGIRLLFHVTPPRSPGQIQRVCSGDEKGLIIDKSIRHNVSRPGRLRLIGHIRCERQNSEYLQCHSYGDLRHPWKQRYFSHETLGMIMPDDSIFHPKQDSERHCKVRDSANSIRILRNPQPSSGKYGRTRICHTFQFPPAPSSRRIYNHYF